MKKKSVSFIFLAATVLLLCSCASGKSIAFCDEQAVKSGIVELSDVQVVIDQVPDRQVARQIELLAKNYLDSSPFNKDSEEIIKLEISVTQRSYLQGTSMVNSIFFSFAFLQEETERNVCQINEYSSGKQTVLSAAVQQKFLNDALNQYFKQKTAGNSKKK